MAGTRALSSVLSAGANSTFSLPGSMFMAAPVVHQLSRDQRLCLPVRFDSVALPKIIS
jgi:hypothetical protein